MGFYVNFMEKKSKFFFFVFRKNGKFNENLVENSEKGEIFFNF